MNALLDEKRDTVTLMAKSLLPAHMFSLQSANEAQRVAAPTGNNLDEVLKSKPDFARSLETLSSCCQLTPDPFEPTPLGPTASQGSHDVPDNSQAEDCAHDKSPGCLDFGFSLQDALSW